MDKLFISNMRKGSNSVNTGYKVMVLKLCNFLYDPFLCILSEI